MDIIPCIGNHLKKIREQKLLSLDDVASQLYLKKALIDDIENGNFEKIRPTYLKGYLRLYAKLLSVSEIDIVQTMHFAAENAVDNKSWKPFYSHKQVKASDKFIQWITYSIISILVVLVTLWWKSDNSLSIKLTDNNLTEPNYMMANNAIGDKIEEPNG